MIQISLGYMQNNIYDGKRTLQIVQNPSSPCLNLVVAESCCGDEFFSAGKLFRLHRKRDIRSCKKLDIGSKPKSKKLLQKKKKLLKDKNGPSSLT